MEVAGTLLWFAALVWAVSSSSGCSKAPVDKDEVTVTFVLSGNPEVMALAWPPSERQREALRVVVGGMQDGDRASVAVPALGYQGSPYQVRDGDKFQIMRVGPGDEERPQITGASDQEETVLKLLVRHVLRDVELAASFVKDIQG